MGKYDSKGEVITITAAADIAAGELVHLGQSRCGVALEAIASGASGSVVISGKFSGGKVTTSAGATLHGMLTPTGTAFTKVTQLENAVVPAESAALTIPNIRSDATVSAAGTVAAFTLLG